MDLCDHDDELQADPGPGRGGSATLFSSQRFDPRPHCRGPVSWGRMPPKGTPDRDMIMVEAPTSYPPIADIYRDDIERLTGHWTGVPTRRRSAPDRPRGARTTPPQPGRSPYDLPAVGVTAVASTRAWRGLGRRPYRPGPSRPYRRGSRPRTPAPDRRRAS